MQTIDVPELKRFGNLLFVTASLVAATHCSSLNLVATLARSAVIHKLIKRCVQRCTQNVTTPVVSLFNDNVCSAEEIESRQCSCPAE